MTDNMVATLLLAGAFLVPVVVHIRRARNAAPAPALDPQVQERAPQSPCSDTNPHHMAVSDLGTWWFCQNDGCTEAWPADEAHHVDLPYDREAVQLVDEAEQFLRSAS